VSTPRTVEPRPGVRLTRPSVRIDDLPSLDPDQRAVVDSGAARLLVVGAPGTGKTTVALELVRDRCAAGLLAPEDVLVLAPTRRGAAELRDRLTIMLARTTGEPVVRTPSSIAFSILRRRALLNGEPGPSLISGPEQDVVLRELLQGHLADDGAPNPWDGLVPPESLALPAFRGELRDLMMRAAERGLGPADLDELGVRFGRREWRAAAVAYQEYLDVTALRQSTPDAGARFDPAVVVDEAAHALAAWGAELSESTRPSWQLVVVDDYQEATAATVRLLHELADGGARLVLLADPDSAVQTFRGASPSFVGRAEVAGAGLGELGATRLVLTRTWRQTPQLRTVTARVTDAIPSVGVVAHRLAHAGEAVAGGAVDVLLARGAAQQVALVADVLRRARFSEAVPWREMAVVVRSGAQLEELRRGLVNAGVPVDVSAQELALREQPAIRPLLVAVRVALGDQAADAEVVTELLTSPVGGLDSVGLRRLRRALRAEELASGGGRSSDALLTEAITDPARLASLAVPQARAARAVAGVLVAARAALDAPGASAAAVLWAVWQATGLGEPWRRAALAGGSAGARADADLDAIVALFRAAEQFTDRLPLASPASFIEYLSGQDLAGDTLAASASAGPAVTLATAAGAAGREWHLVVVAGVQEGTWPDLRLRDSLLGAQYLVDVVAGRTVAAAAESDAAETAAEARRAVLADEVRAFAVAVSRARRRLVVCAVDDADEHPSPLVRLVAEAAGVEPRLAAVERPFDLRGLVAALRAELETACAPDAPAAGGGPQLAGGSDRTGPRLAGLLAELARAGVQGADPAEWRGVPECSTDAPLYPDDALVPVSPSSLETAAVCPLRWMLESSGGRPAGSSAQSLGMLLHDIAEHFPAGTLAELQAELDRLWPALGMPDTWFGRRQKERADAMVERLASYYREHPEPARTEDVFDLVIDRARLRGRVDRLELEADGAARVVDFKTGAAITAAEAAANPQLGAYQLAAEHGAFDGVTTSAGAVLVYLGQGATAPLTRPQPPLSEDGLGAEMIELLSGAVRDMSAARFDARENPTCRTCPVRRSCPVQPEGQQP
jgi:superfamily I DNA/RNA helicase/RecB family exonuclease